MELPTYLPHLILFPRTGQASLKEKIEGFHLAKWKTERIALVLPFSVLLPQVHQERASSITTRTSVKL